MTANSSYSNSLVERSLNLALLMAMSTSQFSNELESEFKNELGFLLGGGDLNI